MLRPLTQEDAVFGVDETPVTVDLPADEERALFFEDLSDATCNGRRRRPATPIDFRSVTGDFTYNEWTAAARFDTGDGDVTFTLPGRRPGRRARSGSRSCPRPARSSPGCWSALIVPIMLGLIGIVILIVTGVLWATRPARPGGG